MPSTPLASGRRSELAVFFPLLGMALAAVFAGAFSRLPPPRLTIASDPPGASVFINGRLAGATPLALAHVAPGAYGIRIEKQGFIPAVVAVEMTSEGASVHPKLQHAGTGLLTVDIKPRGAEVLLDGEIIGYTPLLEKEVPAGSHELLVRRTNFKPQLWRIGVAEMEPVVFRGFALDDLVLEMLRRQIEADKQRVANYMDLGHYLFINDEIDESAEYYARALQVAGTPLEFPKDIDPVERQLEQRLRAEDQTRLNDQIRRKSHWPGKDVARFRKVLEAKQEEVANTHFSEWIWVNETANNFIRQEKYDRAQALLLKHIGAAKKGLATLPQAYIALLSLRLRMHNLPKARETFEQIYNLYGSRADIGRQAANSIYTLYNSYQGEERRQVLAMAEKMLLKAVESSRRGDPEMLAQCRYELGNVYFYQERFEAAVPVYRESIDGTRHEETKESRRQHLVEAYKALGNYPEARAVLAKLVHSPRENVATQAEADLRELKLLKPSPDSK